jgi:hypothetical protein
MFNIRARQPRCPWRVLGRAYLYGMNECGRTLESRRRCTEPTIKRTTVELFSSATTPIGSCGRSYPTAATTAATARQAPLPMRAHRAGVSSAGAACTRHLRAGVSRAAASRSLTQMAHGLELMGWRCAIRRRDERRCAIRRGAVQQKMAQQKMERPWRWCVVRSPPGVPVLRPSVSTTCHTAMHPRCVMSCHVMSCDAM